MDYNEYTKQSLSWKIALLYLCGFFMVLNTSSLKCFDVTIMIDLALGQIFQTSFLAVEWRPENIPIPT